MLKELCPWFAQKPTSVLLVRFAKSIGLHCPVSFQNKQADETN